MASRPRQVVYVDTNVVIEATRTGCWKALVQAFEIRTVEEVRRESATKPKDTRDYVAVDMAFFDGNVTVEKVTARDVLLAQATAPGVASLDPGERDLLAKVAQVSGAIILTTGDKAAVKSACLLGLSERLVSLEELASKSGSRPKVRGWFTAAWLRTVKTEALLDSGDNCF